MLSHAWDKRSLLIRIPHSHRGGIIGLRTKLWSTNKVLSARGKTLVDGPWPGLPGAVWSLLPHRYALEYKSGTGICPKQTCCVNLFRWRKHKRKGVACNSYLPLDLALDEIPWLWATTETFSYAHGFYHRGCSCHDTYSISNRSWPSLMYLIVFRMDSTHAGDSYARIWPLG